MMNRRTFVSSLVAGLGVALLPGRASAATSPRLVFVFLRGGTDALSLFAPRGADWTRYQQLRPSIAMTSPLAFSPELWAHPALQPLIASGSFGLVLHGGGVVDTRSHFDQQYLIELGRNTASGTAGSTGFLARIARALAVRTAAIDRRAPHSLTGVSPVVLSDPARLQPGYSDDRLDPHWTRAQRLAMYRGGPAPIDAAATQALSDGNALATDLAGATLASLTASHGYIAADPFAGRLALTAALMGSSLDPRVFAVEGGQFWDTHNNQQTMVTTGYRTFGVALANLATNVAAFRRDLVARGRWSSTVIVVMSEFGRTIAENGNAGTDHGRGGALLLLGGPVRAFSDPRYLGTRRWQLPAVIDASTPTSVIHDYRAVVAEILERHLGMSRAAAHGVFANEAASASPLDVLV